MAKLHMTRHRTMFFDVPLLTLVDVDFQDLFLPQDFASSAGLAAVTVVQTLALAMAAAADGGDLLHHAWSQLMQPHLHPTPPARRAHLHGPFTAPTT